MSELFNELVKTQTGYNAWLKLEKRILTDDEYLEMESVEILSVPDWVEGKNDDEANPNL